MWRRHGAPQSGVLSRGRAVRPGLAAWECAHEVWECASASKHSGASTLVYSPPPSSAHLPSWLILAPPPLLRTAAAWTGPSRRCSSLVGKKGPLSSHLLPPSSFFLRGWQLLCASYCCCAAATYISCWFARFAASDIFDFLLLTCCSPIGLGVEALHIRRYFDANRVLVSCWTTD
jgi:hypothetical protein